MKKILSPRFRDSYSVTDHLLPNLISLPFTEKVLKNYLGHFSSQWKCPTFDIVNIPTLIYGCTKNRFIRYQGTTRKKQHYFDNQSSCLIEKGIRKNG